MSPAIGSLKSAIDSESKPVVSPVVEGQNWIILVESIKRGDRESMEELYRVFSRGVRYYLCRQLGAQDIDDKVHDTFLIVVQAIQRDELREPERLMGFVRTIVRRQVAAQIDRAVQSRKEQVDIESTALLSDCHESPEAAAISREHAQVAEAVLRGISERDRDILTRFYLMEQSQEEICQEMNLSETQFRLLKSRAKARFGELGRKKLARRKII